MKSFIACAIATSAYASAAIRANKVCVENMGGYDLNWWVDDLITGNQSANSGSYPIDQDRCNTIVITDLSEGDFLEVYVHAVAGVTKSADTAIIYQTTPAVTATYTCRGTTLNFQCTLNGELYVNELLAAGLEVPEDLLL